jgi:hypothetical protein
MSSEAKETDKDVLKRVIGRKLSNGERVTA